MYGVYGVVTGRNGHNRNAYKPKRPQTKKATNRNGHRLKMPQTKTATDQANRNGHRPKRLSKGHMSIWMRMTPPMKDRVLIRIMRRKMFHSSSRIRVELIRRTSRRVSACTVQRCLVAAGYHSRRPARCPKLTHDHRRRRHCRIRRHRNWNHQHWSHVISADESRFIL